MTPGVSSPTGITLNPASPSELWIVDKTTDRVYQYNAAVGVIFKASDIALIQLSDDFVRSRVGKPFERERADSEPSLAPPQSRNNVVSFSTQQSMQPARSENRASSQAVPRDTLLSVLKAQGARTLAAQV